MRDLTERNARNASSDATRLLASIKLVEPSEGLGEIAAFMRCTRVNDCKVCGGWGWKFSLFRRSVATAGDAGEHALLGRARTPCTACNGLPTGQAETGGSDD